MKKLLLLGALTLIGWLSPTLAAPTTKADTPLAGHYYLKNAREVGSELLLKPDGSFEWGMSYGAVDQYAEGKWQRQHGKVVLQTAAPDKEPDFRLFRDEELRIRKPAEPGTWLAIVGMPGVGPMAGVEVTFESKAGKTATAVTDRNGDATVDMSDSETWARAGLRREGSKAPLQWFAIPAGRAAAHLTAFAVDDIAYLRPQPFKTLQLQVKGSTLVVDDGSGMVYERK
ncbi:hypothetical protein QU487_15770 [Crenobacter sp. SG2305]|uniref:hypothetical protein n=1 Tax=Crenobacter oryzisoli TaxID=3056844 RepID=UPI0025AB1424|nr:hypothetical protein [Crenobacter sp. SG2305]MDN0084199.1 hypothetical protein [Crenobacter sp. SG2305]